MTAMSKVHYEYDERKHKACTDARRVLDRIKPVPAPVEKPAAEGEKR